MGRLFDHAGLLVTDDWIRTPTGRYAIADVRDAWVGRRRYGSGSHWLTAGLGTAAMLVVAGGAGLTGWLTRNWLWLIATPALVVVACAVGLLDPIAIYLEKRHHQLWINTDGGPVLLWKANAVEARKALRQIQRARQRHFEAHDHA